MFLVSREIEITAGRNPLKLFRAKGKLTQDINTSARVMSELLFRLPMVIKDISAQTNAVVEFRALIYPVAMPHLPAPVILRNRQINPLSIHRHPAVHRLNGLIRLDEKLKFHLLEFPRSKSEILRRHFVPKGLANLADSKWNFDTAGIEHVFELSKNRLRRFRSEIRHIRLRRCRPKKCAQHQIKRPRFIQPPARLRMKIHRILHHLNLLLPQQNNELGRSRTLARILRYERPHPLAETLNMLAILQQGLNHTRALPPRRRFRTRKTHSCSRLRLNMISAHPLVRERALAHQVSKSIHVTRGFPDRRVH